MIFKQKKIKGFTLFEMLLVLVIITSVLLMMMTYMTTKTDESKRDVTVMQYEQILNAGLSYYINHSDWPTTIGTLQTENYLPKTPTNPWQGTYTFYNNTTTGTFSICSVIGFASGSSTDQRIPAETGIMAGRLPMGYVAPGTTCPGSSTPPAAAACTASTCLLISTVNIPGQNLNNARSVNFAGLYHNSGCVPAPVCPNPYSASNTTGMVPTIIVVPVSVSGTYMGNNELYPLSSFTAYAVGNGNPSGSPPVAVPVNCTNNTPTACDFTSGIASPAGLYWRVCLEVWTDQGKISGINWKDTSGTVMAITRCVPNNEPRGSGFHVFQSF